MDLLLIQSCCKETKKRTDYTDGVLCVVYRVFFDADFGVTSLLIQGLYHTNLNKRLKFSSMLLPGFSTVVILISAPRIYKADMDLLVSSVSRNKFSIGILANSSAAFLFCW